MIGLEDKIVLVTGGTGTFGSAALRRFLKMGAREIRVFSRDEKKQDDMRHQFADPRLKFIIGDVRNFDSVKDAMLGANCVFHAAALKQVPSCEFYPMEAVRTNILGSDNVLRASVEAGVKNVVVLSTDKAAYPINAMGTSKAMMEKVAMAHSRNASEVGTTISITRYGNVMASRGSVIPLFIDQIQRGVPITITDPKMTRFLMSVDDAIDLVLFAFDNARPGDLFIQKAPSAYIGTLVEAVLELFQRTGKTPVQVIGTRHGEKLYEVLMTREERAHAEDMGDYYRIPADTRDLNYSKFVSEGADSLSNLEDFNSHNAELVDKDTLIAMIRKLDLVQDALKGFGLD